MKLQSIFFWNQIFYQHYKEQQEKEVRYGSIGYYLCYKSIDKYSQFEEQLLSSLLALKNASNSGFCSVEFSPDTGWNHASTASVILWPTSHFSSLLNDVCHISAQWEAPTKIWNIEIAY